jgi:hypothetical protein
MDPLLDPRALVLSTVTRRLEHRLATAALTYAATGNARKLA